MLELESCCQQAPTESNMKDNKRQGFYFFQPLAKETRLGLHQLNSTLFINTENHKNLYKHPTRKKKRKKKGNHDHGHWQIMFNLMMIK
jgi:predicted O-linked N-acetylglucosamine transferase (SPINDLY family)